VAQLLRSLPSQELLADATGHDILEVGDSLGFDALSLRFLAFLGQNELHALAFLLGPKLFFNRLRKPLWQSDSAKRRALYRHASGFDQSLEVFQDLGCQ
jgi:hypothetical protein